MGPVVQVPADPRGCNPSSASGSFGPNVNPKMGVPPLPGDKPFLFNDLRGLMACKYVIAKGIPLNLANKQVSSGGVVYSPLGLLVFDLYIKYSGLKLTKMPTRSCFVCGI
jgi:hypothetical protein